MSHQKANPDVTDSSEVSKLLNSLDSRVITGLQTLASLILKDPQSISESTVTIIKCLRQKIDKQLSDQVNLILHHPQFQQLESTWRGLSHLVRNTLTDEMLKIKVFNISKRELAKTLRPFSGNTWDQSPIYQRIYRDVYENIGREPYGCLLADYYFDHSPADVSLLQQIAGIAAAAQAPFVAGASPSIFGMESWQELEKPRQLAKQFTTPDYAGWRSLRESPDSCYLGLTMPRFLARLPYGAETEAVKGFAFEEETGNGKHDKYCWANSAYAMGVNTAHAFKLHGWCVAIRGMQTGGEFKGLLCHTFPTDDGGVDTKGPTEIAINHRREKELSDCGFISLMQLVKTDRAAFFGAQSVNHPPRFRDPDAQASAHLAARLPYVFASCRIVHYLKAICRDYGGQFRSREELEKLLRNWIDRYVLGDAVGSNLELKASKPLADAHITVHDLEGDPGYDQLAIQIRPHYQLEGISVCLRVTTNVPTVVVEDDDSFNNILEHAVGGSSFPVDPSAAVGDSTSCEITPESAAEAPLANLDENVQFTVYRPTFVIPERWYAMLAFAHLDALAIDVPPDEPDPLETVKRQAEAIIGDQLRAYRHSRQESKLAIPREGELTFVPEISGFRFHPAQQTILWMGCVEHVEFKFRAERVADSTTARGHLCVFFEHFLLASIPISICVDYHPSARRSVETINRTSALPYRKIFASYSHHDLEIVEECARFSRLLGDTYLRDAVSLRSGEQWNNGLKDLIRQADVFQLFWSTNSMHSRFVEREWRYALSLGRPSFVRPTYWEEPLPSDPSRHLPPPELDRLHFQRLPCGRSSGVSDSDSATAVESMRKSDSLATSDPSLPPTTDSWKSDLQQVGESATQHHFWRATPGKLLVIVSTIAILAALLMYMSM